MSTVLIADDNVQNLYLARFLLERDGCDVDEVHNGQEAVDAVSRKRYDLVVMDIQMPVMGGLEATGIIKAQDDAPVIVAMTARAMLGDKDNILAAGCDGYIEKPIIPRVFSEQIKGYLAAVVE